MQPRDTVYGLVLTLDPQKINFDAAEYQNTEDEEVIKKFKRISRKHMHALVQSLRRHAKTRLGKKWNAEIIVVSSCKKGICISKLKDKTKIPKQKPDRLHYHVLIKGLPGSTIGECITKYWESKYGFVEKKQYDYSDVENWINEYFNSQIMTKRTLAIKSTVLAHSLSETDSILN